MDGIILIKKPKDITSRDVVDAVSRKLQTKKVGHTGTLDPFATGLLMITVNKATKAGTFIESLDKTYEAVIQLGKKTDTGDLTGTVIEETPLIDLDKTYVQQVLETFIGEQDQVPPMYSAIKKDGVPMYKLAREGITIDREARRIVIYNITLTGLTQDTLSFQVRSSKGTYVRTLAENICEKMGLVGHLSSLVRTHIGTFALANAFDLTNVHSKHLISVYDALTHFEKIIIDHPLQKKAIEDGKAQTFKTQANKVLLVTPTKEVLAVYQRSEDGLFRSLRGLF
jgi:tRNA pseudouridine55 synthase